MRMASSPYFNVKSEYLNCLKNKFNLSHFKILKCPISYFATECICSAQGTKTFIERKKRPQRVAASLKHPQRVIRIMALIKLAVTRCG